MNDMARYTFGVQASEALTASLEMLTQLETLAQTLREEIEGNTAAKPDGSRYLTIKSGPVDTQVAEELAALADQISTRVKKGAAFTFLAMP